MKNIEYQSWTSKYTIILPILATIGGFGLYFYRIYYLSQDGATAFFNVDLGMLSPLTLIFGGIIVFFIILGIQSFESRISKLDKKEQQKEFRNKVIKDFRREVNKEKTHTYFYIIVGLLSLTAYVLIASNDYEGAKDLILFLIIGILVPLTQAIKLYKFVKYKNLKKLKDYGKCLTGKIVEIKKKGKGFLRDDTMRYQIIAKSEETGDTMYKSQKVRFDLPYFLQEGDKINIYIETDNPGIHYVDIESAFIFGEDK